MPKTHIQQMVEEIDKILNSFDKGSKEKTLLYQRGYLTGWLARLATQDWVIREEIKTKLRNKSGAGSENRTRN